MIKKISSIFIILSLFISMSNSNAQLTELISPVCGQRYEEMGTPILGGDINKHPSQLIFIQVPDTKKPRYYAVKTQQDVEEIKERLGEVKWFTLDQTLAIYRPPRKKLWEKVLFQRLCFSIR